MPNICSVTHARREEVVYTVVGSATDSIRMYARKLEFKNKALLRTNEVYEKI